MRQVPSSGMPVQAIEDPLDRKPEYSSQPYLRPYVLGVAAIVAVMGAIIVIDQNRQNATERFSLTPGKMQVAGGGAPVSSGAGSPAEAGRPPKVGVYDMADGKTDTATIDAQSKEVVVRPLPLPPPVTNVTGAAPTSPPESPARKTPDTQSLAEMVTEAVDQPASAPAPAPAPAAKAAPQPEPEAAPAAVARDEPRAPAPPVAEAKAVEKKIEKAAESTYTLQVASFSKQPMAQDLADRLANDGFKSYLVSVDLGSKGTWWRVRVGHYPTEHAAKWARLDLVKEGLSPIVVHDGPDQP